MWQSLIAKKINFSFFCYFCLSLTLPSCLFGDQRFDQDIALKDNQFELSSPQYLPLEAKWCFASGDCIDLEVADTEEEKILGLMHRKSLPNGKGMLFLFDPPREARFWMYKTFLQLDMIFFSNNIVISIESDVNPCHELPCQSYGPDENVDGVIEIAGGESLRMNIKLGDYVDIRYIEE